MKFNAVLTKEQAKEMFAYLEDIFTEVKVLDIEAVRRLEKDKNSISLKASRYSSSLYPRTFATSASLAFASESAASPRTFNISTT